MAKALTPYQGPTYGVVDPRIADVEAVARWLDYIFVLPGGFRFGMAGIIGLIPGIGDVIDGLVSLYIVYRAIQLGVPRVSIARMMINGLAFVFGGWDKQTGDKVTLLRTPGRASAKETSTLPP